MFKRFFLIFVVILFIMPINALANGVSASSYVVLDSASKQAILSSNMNEQRSMASTTKIMTCLIACESNVINSNITITAQMLDGAIGSLIYLDVGDEISFIDLIKGAMLASGNDSANALAVVIAGSVPAFVEMMNKKADEIGMKNTYFVTPSGLDEGNHHSTAYDMALLTAYALNNELFSSICSMKSAEIFVNGKSQMLYNHNKLLSFSKECVGVKTGFTEKAGRCLVSAFKYKDNTIIIVTLNAPNDWDDHQKLYELAKKKYKKNKINQNFEIPSVGSAENYVKCKANANVYSIDKLTFKAYYFPFVYAPICVNDTVGKLEIYEGDMLIKTVDIIVEEEIKLWQITK